MGPGMESAIKAMMFGDVRMRKYDEDELRRVLSCIRNRYEEAAAESEPRKRQIGRHSTAEDSPHLDGLEEEQRGRKKGDGTRKRGREQRGDGGVDHIKANCKTGTEWRQGQQRPRREKISETERTSVETALFVEKFQMAKVEVAADADADLNRASVIHYQSCQK